MDEQRGRPGLRLELGAPGHRGALLLGRLEASLRAGLLGRLVEGDEPRLLRPLRESGLAGEKGGVPPLYLLRSTSVRPPPGSSGWGRVQCETGQVM